MTLAILDIDGTLVDTNYHHSLSWYRAFRHHGITLPMWRIHRHIGMGGDQVIPSLTDEQTEQDKGSDIRETEKGCYSELIGEVSVMEGARDLIEALKQRGHTVILASSAKEDEVDHYLDLLDARDLADGWTTSADVDATKPEPDLVKAALQHGSAPAGDAVMIGDTPWDIEAAQKADVGTIAVLTGGFATAELEKAGAVGVFERVRDLCSSLDDTPLA